MHSESCCRDIMQHHVYVVKTIIVRANGFSTRADEARCEVADDVNAENHKRWMGEKMAKQDE